MWAPDVIIPPIAIVTSSPLLAAQERIQSKTQLVPTKFSPQRDAARMAALKKLRHRMVVLCSSACQMSRGANKKPLPVLCFERWLARYALRRGSSSRADDSYSDPLIPSDGFVDMGLVKDLGRSIPPTAASEVAGTLAVEAQKAAACVIETAPDEELDKAAGRKRARNDIKVGLRAVKATSKAAQAALKAVDDYSHDGDGKTDANNRDGDDGDQEELNASVRLTLNELRSATAVLETTVQTAQRDATNPVAAGVCGGVTINGSRRPGIYDIAMKGPNGKPNRPYLTVSGAHLWKLVQLWTFARDEEQEEGRSDNKSGSTTPIDGDPIKYIDAMSEEEQPRLRMAIYCCLSRYEALSGAGYQCAVPGVAFDAAARCGLGTTVECFASPLNCRYRRYCSAFPDIETAFGSLGSFFDDTAFNPNEGSFEANPPFVPETMEAMRKKIERILEDKGRGPLSFLVVVPAWGAGASFCHSLEKSNHTRATARVPAADHAFFDGAQHTKPSAQHRTDDGPASLSALSSERVVSLLRPSSWDTAVILMQNNAGEKLWPVSEETLKASFCAALRDATKTIPESSSTLEKWERRGVADGGSLKHQHGLAPKRHNSSSLVGQKHPSKRAKKL